MNKNPITKFFPLLAVGFFIGCASAPSDTITLNMGEVVTYEREEAPALASAPQKRAPAPRPVRKSDMRLEAAHFELDSARLTAQGEDALEQMAEILHAYPMAPVILVGHTCSIGREAHNRDLSLRRAKAVRKILRQEHGVINPIRVKGKGSSEPRVSNNTQEGREANRRVEIYIFK